MSDIKRNEDGTIKKGERLGKETEFKEGEHWREEKPFWNRQWLIQEYIEKEKSCGDIAENFDVKPKTIRYHLKKHNIDRRSLKEARDIKHWGAEGKQNGMYGRTGEDNPNYVDGSSPERQTLYSQKKYKEVIKECYRKDDYQCQKCGGVNNLHAHHIIPWCQSEEHRFDQSNLITLCRNCHEWVHSNDNTEGKYLGHL